ncbi:hypothetical protein AB0I28_15285 [Phytomonospora sp. NPDC050363]|uniref:hypothetical protein n=1 Tax=Phytomonospora sp. NPDC050363 TaxID=3155642 RepID=UPI0034026B2E
MDLPLWLLILALLPLGGLAYTAWLIVGAVLAHRTVRLSDPVAGELTVVAVSSPSSGPGRVSFVLDGVVRGAGFAPTAVKREGRIDRGRWPWPGTVLDVEVERGDPARFNINWPAAGVDGAEAARRLAEEMRRGEA